MKKLVSIFGLALMISLMFITTPSCVKQDFDTPPIGNIPVGEMLSIGQIRQIYADSGEYVFTKDYSVYGTVVMGEATGNIYKAAYIQDTSGAVNLYLKESTELQAGDYIRVNINGGKVSDYNDLLQIDLSTISPDTIISILANGNFMSPRTVTIEELNDAMDGGYFEEYESQLVRFDSVQFSLGELGKTYADEEGYGERNIEDCSFNTTMVRTSNYAGFAYDPLPEGRGSLVAIASRYQTDIQLIIRSTFEVQLTGPRCGSGGGPAVTEIDEDFSEQEDYTDVAIEGWLNVALDGSRRWQGKTFNDEVYAQATSYNSEEINECWLITPAIALDEMTTPMASFISAQAYWEHDGLRVFFSTDFNGANVEGATWTELQCTIAGENDPDHDWIPSGDIDLSNFSGTGYLAFQYTGNDNNGNTTSYRVDDVKVWDEAK